MKLKKKLFVFGVATVILMGCQSTTVQKETSTMQSTDSFEEYDKSVEKLHQLSAEELDTVLQKEQSILVYAGRRTCPACRQFLPQLVNVMDKVPNVTVYYIDVETKSEKLNGFLNDYNVQYVPTLLRINTDKTATKFDGDTLEKLETFLKQ